MKKKTTRTNKRAKLSPAEQERWDIVVGHMVERGIDPQSRRGLILDYVKVCSRIDLLSGREEDPLLGHVGVSRQIGLAEVERRHLYDALLEGANDLDPGPTPEQIAARLAYTQWAHFVHYLDGTAEDQRDARELEVEQQLGECPMRALIVPRHVPITREHIQEFYDWMSAQSESADAA